MIVSERGCGYMGRFVNPDNSAFQVALNSQIYVDKTTLISYMNSVLDTTDAYICNSRPRRFGKSYTANMLAAYYSKGCNSEKMFSRLAISKDANYRKHLNKYDVIHIDIQWFLSNSKDADGVVQFIKTAILSELKEIYPYILSEAIYSVSDALSIIREKTGQKFIIIIDEWDVLIRDEAANQEIQTEYLNFLRGLFKGVEPTRYIQLAYLTGILPFKKEKTQSAVNNLKHYSMLSAGPLAPYIGFTEEEVKELCAEHSQNFAEVKRWYDGYKIGKYHVYNPNAVVRVIADGEFQSYWSGTASYETIVPLINMDYDGLKGAIIEMLSGAQVKLDVSSFQNDTINFANRDDILTYLIHLGYLAYDQTRQAAFIPNEEIRQELIRATRRKKWQELSFLQKESERLLDATLDMENEIVAAQIEKIHEEYVSVIRYHDENSLSSVLAIAYLSAMEYYFKPVRELPAGRGFADFVFIPKPEYLTDYPALVVELKWNKNASTALQQIKEKRYPASIKGYTGNILLVGINYDEKTKVHECLIEQYQCDA